MKDLLRNTNGTLKIEAGDFVIGDSDAQHITTLLYAEKGTFKQFPDTGVGIRSFLEDEKPDNMYAEIRRQLAADGVKISGLEYGSDKQLKLDASYE